MKNWQEDQMQILLSMESEQQLLQKLILMTKELGFDYCSYGLRSPFPVSNPKTVMLNNYPDVWQKQYKDQNYLAIDPTIKRGMQSLLPFVWSNEVFSPAYEFWEEAQSFGLRFGWVQSSYDIHGIFGLLSLGRSNEKLSDTELLDKCPKMMWLTQIAHQTLSQCITPKLIPETEAKLSNREIEVLRWTAEGKTSSEIGDILNLSECTINFHINNAMTKLNATNKTAAAIRAMTLRLLS